MGYKERLGGFAHVDFWLLLNIHICIIHIFIDSMQTYFSGTEGMDRAYLDEFLLTFPSFMDPVDMVVLLRYVNMLLRGVNRLFRYLSTKFPLYGSCWVWCRVTGVMMRSKEKRNKEERKRGREEEGRVKGAEWGGGRNDETHTKRQNRYLYFEVFLTPFNSSVFIS